MKRFLLRCLGNVIGIYVASLIFTAIAVSSPLALLGAGLVLGLINFFLRPIILLITLPINIITIGIFTLVINAWLVQLTSYLIGGIHIPTFIYSLAVAIIISALNMWLNRLCM